MGSYRFEVDTVLEFNILILTKWTQPAYFAHYTLNNSRVIPISHNIGFIETNLKEETATVAPMNEEFAIY